MSSAHNVYCLHNHDTMIKQETKYVGVNVFNYHVSVYQCVQYHE